MDTANSPATPSDALSAKLHSAALMAHFRASGVSKVDALHMFIGIAQQDAADLMEKEIKGTFYEAQWVRRYHDAGDTIKTILLFPLIFVPILPFGKFYSKEMSYKTVHRMHEERASESAKRRFFAGCLQVVVAVLVFFSMISGAIAFMPTTWVEYGFLCSLISALLVLCWLYVLSRAYRWSKRFAIPRELRPYSANGLFEYRGLKKVT